MAVNSGAAGRQFEFEQASINNAARVEVLSVRDDKPICTLANGAMASAAYWVGSAADAVYITDSTTQVGSIGVVATHTDISKAQENQGIKTTEIFAGQYKRIASTYAPLSKEGRQTMQDQVDYTYGLFVNAVAKHRGVSAETVLNNMADGRIFIGQQAIDAGLVDGVSTLGALVQQLNHSRMGGNPQGVRPGRAGVAQPHPQPKGAAMPITREQLAAEAPDVLAAIQAEGASAERQRARRHDGVARPGHVEHLARDGGERDVHGAELGARADRGAARHRRADHATSAQDRPSAETAES